MVAQANSAVVGTVYFAQLNLYDLTAYFGAGEYYHGVTVAIDATVAPGYEWNGWSGTHTTTTKQYTFTMPTSNVSDTANANIITYALTYYTNGGTNPNDAVTSYNVETATFNLPTPVRTGYTFEGWYPSTELSGTKVTEISKGTTGNKAFYAKWSANTNTKYTVNHYQMNTSGTYPSTAIETENKTGTTDSTITLSDLAKTYTGFTYNSGKVGNNVVTTTTIAADGTRVVNLYYTRNQYTVTLTKTAGISEVTGAGKYYYGETVTIDATLSEGYTWNSWSGTYSTLTKKYTFNMADSNVENTANATVNTYSVSYDANGGTGAPNPTTYTYNPDKYTTLSTTQPNKTGYEFLGWSETKNSATAEIKPGDEWWQGNAFNKTIYAVWKGKDDTVYTVNHYLMNTSGTYPSSAAETESKQGTTDSTITLSTLAKTYTGFTYNSGKVGGTTVTTTTVAPDGSRVINLYYTRNKYTVSLTKGTGISAVSGAGSYYHGVSVTIDATVMAGYEWKNWTGTETTTTKKYTFTMPTSNVSYTANTNIVTYSISYELNGGTATNPTSYNVETATFALNNPTKTGYSFAGWTGSNGETPSTTVSIVKGTTGNKSYTANWTANPTKYTVNHYQMNISGTYPNTATETQNLTEAADSTITLSNLAKTYTGFTYSHGQVGGSTVTTTTISADGSRVINLYYTRNKYTVSLTKGNGISAVSGAGSYYHGAPVTIDATVSNGYEWKNWSGTHSTTTKQYTFTMPTSNVKDTANANVITYSISYELNGGTVTPANPTSYDVTTATFTLTNPTRTGYTFTGWTGSNGETPSTSVSIAKGSTGTKSYTANWDPNEDTKYTVNHYQMNTSGTYPSSATATETLEGTTAATLTLSNLAKSYTGFTYSYGQVGGTTVTTTTITADGKRVINLYYARTKYTVTLTKGTGISAVSGAGEYYHGASVTIDATLSSGYEWKNWSGTHSETTKAYTFIMPTSNVSDTANASVITYTISYTLNGGTVTNPTSYNVTTATFTLKNPTKEGYTFTGWTGSNGETPSTSVSIAKGTTGNKSYTANYTANPDTPYTVNHYQMNTSGTYPSTPTTTENKTGTTASTLTLSNLAKSYTGFTYSYGGVGGTTVTTTTVAADGTRVINLYYTRTKYTVSLTKGTGISEVSGAGSYYHGASVTIDATVSKGYEWKNWSGTHSTTTKQYTFTMPTSNVTDTANATVKTYTISYNANGGTGTMSSHTVTYGSSIKIKDNEFTAPKGQKFIGWTTNSSGTNDGYGWSTSSATGWSGTWSYDNGQYGIANNELKLYAMWGPKTFTIEYDANGGTGTMSSHTVTYGNSIKIKDNEFTAPKGYKFAGWTTNSNGTNDGHGWSTSSATGWSGTWSYDNGQYGIANDNLKLYARWTIETYSISYTLNGGVATNPTSYNVNTATFTLTNPTREGYTFAGWTGSNGTTASTSVSIAKGSTGNKSYTANWTANTYSISYDANGGTGAPSQTSYTYDPDKYTILSTTVPTNTGYEFLGWSETKDSSTAEYQPGDEWWQGNAFNKTIYAVWKGKDDTPYTVNHYLMNTSGTYPTSATETESKTGTTDSTLTLSDLAKTYTGFTYSYGQVGGTTVTTTTVLADGKRVINLYYTRTKYTVSLTKGTGISAVSGAGSYYHGASVTIDATVSTGYEWKNWTGTETTTTKKYTFTMPTSNVSYTANATAITYTAKIDPNGGYRVSGNTYDVLSFNYTYGQTDTISERRKTGYILTGYTITNTASGSTTDIGGATVTFDSSTKSATFKQGSVNVTITAQWQAIIYTAHFNPNGGYRVSDTNYDTVSYNYKYGDTDGISERRRTGYTLTGYTITNTASGSTTDIGGATVTFDSSTKKGTFKQGTVDVTITANWELVSYTISYNLGGGTVNPANPTSYNIETATFTLTNPTRTGYTFAGWTGSNGTTASTSVSIAKGSTGDKSYTANWTPVKYTISYDLGGGTVNPANPTSYNIETATFTLTNPTKTGYIFTGWTGSNGNTPSTSVSIAKGSTGNKSYTANWKPGTANYKVNHYQMNTSGTYPSSATATETLSGETTSTLTLSNLAKSYTGFTYNYGQVGGTTVTTTTIAADGSRVINLYYTRTKYTVSLTKGTGISAVSGAGSYYHGASVTIDATVSTGYTWSKWSGTHSTTTKKYTFTMPASNVSDTANATANTNTKYTVNHYQMNTSGTYPSSATATESKTGTTAATLSIAGLAKSYTGFTYSYGQVGGTTVTTTTISADGSRVINLYYTRNKYTVSLTKGTGISAVSGAGSYYYGASVTIDATVSTGYTWSKWSGTHSTTTKQYTFTMPASNVKDTASATINYYTVSLTAGTGISSVSGAGTYAYGTTIIINATVATGYTWSKWSGTFTGTIKQYSFKVTSNVSLTASATANTYSITYHANGGSGAPGVTTYVYNTNENTRLSDTRPTRTGYTFKGWSESSTATTATYSPYQTWWRGNAANYNLYAVWQVNSITFHYYSNNGSQTNFVNWTFKYTDSYPDSHWNYTNGQYALTRQGYAPTGYYGTTTTGGTLVHEERSFSSYADLCSVYGVSTQTSSTTINLYAQWQRATQCYKVTQYEGLACRSAAGYNQGSVVTNYRYGTQIQVSGTASYYTETWLHVVSPNDCYVILTSTSVGSC